MAASACVALSWGKGTKMNQIKKLTLLADMKARAEIAASLFRNMNTIDTGCHGAIHCRPDKQLFLDEIVRAYDTELENLRRSFSRKS